MIVYTNEQIIKGIADRNSRIIEYIYSNYYDAIRKLILLNNGSLDDVKDTFQEALYIIYQKITLGELTLKCQFKTYLYSVCRFIWLNEIRKRHSSTATSEGLPDLNPSQFTIGAAAEAGFEIFLKHFQELSENCKKVLDMYFRNVSLEEIRLVMGYKNIQIAKDKCYRCKKKLFTRIYNNPEYKKLKDEIFMAG
ncbi:MAG: hypothetical protein AMS27_16650 [Bacteroides sp. SM23_62_1]|nr:MAG: hypothetical protein AMS27_16650 [Bacteroides sp. SM23_62_1]